MSAETYWDAYEPKARKLTDEERLSKGFNWTQWDDGHGPGEELLGKPERALELGCGKGREAAYLALRGVEVTALDLSGAQIAAAREHWGHLDIGFVHADAVDYLARPGDRFDAIFSVWGASWFTDPAQLVPLVRERLAPGGTYAFSCAPPVRGCYGPQGMYGEGYRGDDVPVLRWAYTAEMWEGILRNYGFHAVDARVIPGPGPASLGTLVVQAWATPA